ncbi:MAP/microtubule affinity-regulating kinase 3-like [Branchiostoma floridae]|uniref:MAP/microtubule affinity-regulating kinase 3-like n=1 Tax=Branchiostoma floridae TaxID=7739 RepID=A0A9J7KLS0_BRAFL|nr:MAP/microtubule affinity-regulating kinase 3-like [Branchiostoma floridae]
MDLEEISSEYWEDPIKWECGQYGYSVIKNIAIGSFGDIKLANAEDSALERREDLAGDADAKGHSLVAVKIVHTGNDDYASDILPREVNTLRRLHHPNVMKMYEYFYVAARTYIVLEYCGTNGRLGEFIRQYRAGRGLGLAEDAVRHFTKQLVNGMKYVHKRGIVHRDLRADNILLDDKYNIKISGFGYATKLEKGVGLVDLSDPSFEEKTSRLALEYTPPEAFSYDKYLGKPADVWSLGVVLYMMLAGKKPFTAPQHKSQQVRASLYCKAVWERSGKQSYSNRISKEAKILSRKLLDVKDDARPTLKQLSASRWLKNAILQPDRLMNLVRLHKDQYRDLAGVGEAERAPSEIDQEPLFMSDFMGLTAPNPWRNGVASPRSGVASPQSGMAFPQSGVASPQSGVASPQSGVASPQPGVASPQSGVASPQSGVASPQSGVASPQSGVASPQSSVASPQSGVAPPQPGVASPPKSGVASPIGRAHDDAYPSGNATPDVKPRRHVEKSDEEKSRRARRGRNLVPMKQTGVGNLVGASGFVPKPPPGKKCVAGGVATPPSGSGQRPASQAQIKKRGRRIPDSGSKGKNNRELTTNKSGSFKARTPSSFLCPPPEGRTQEEPQEGVSKYLEDGGPRSPNRFTREIKGVKKVPAKRTSRFKARTPSPSSPCPSPTPECLTQEDPEEDGVLTYLGGGGPTMKLSPDGRKLLPATQKDVGNLVASTGFVPKPPPGKKCAAAGVATPSSGQRCSSQAQIKMKGRRIQQIDSGSNRQKDGDLNKNGRLTQEESVGGVLKLEDGGPCSPNRFTRDTKIVEKLPAKRTSRFKARTPSPSSPCLSPPPECLTQEDPEEDGVLTYLGGGGPTMKLSPDGRKLLPMTQKDVDGTSFVPKPPSGKKCAAGGVATPPPGQRPASQSAYPKRNQWEVY